VPAWQAVTATAAELLAMPLATAPPLSSLELAYRAILVSLATARPQQLAAGAVHFDDDFVVRFAIPTGAGLGSSAALAVAVVRAIDLSLGLALRPVEVDAAAFAAEQVFHGQPSGLDHTVAQQGGFGLFRRGHGLLGLSDLPALRLTLCVGHTGRARDTKGRVARVAELYASEPQQVGARFTQIGQLVAAAVQALRDGQLGSLGALMDRNQQELAALEVSCPEIEDMCGRARRAGALGAKLTGGGGGGCVIALAPGAEAAVRAAWEHAGYSSFLVQIGNG
jgi:hydroxymethylglutaryl-CoA reductase